MGEDGLEMEWRGGPQALETGGMRGERKSNGGRLPGLSMAGVLPGNLFTLPHQKTLTFDHGCWGHSSGQQALKMQQIVHEKDVVRFT